MVKRGKMNLFLHTPDSASALAECYRRAFERATELFIVTAYLTEWDGTLVLNGGCKRFRLIVGKDFGITRKAACEKVMRWLPPQRKSQFMVADMIAGFHPKAVFWKENDNCCFAIIGSSNLTRAAFETNYEANFFSKISEAEYEAAKQWVRSIEQQAVPVSEDWLSQYKESARANTGGGTRGSKALAATPLVTLKLPRPAGTKRQIDIRRRQLEAYDVHREGLISLFRSCSKGQVSSSQFYEQLPNYWSYKVGNRLQGAGWERQGKGSDFRALSTSYVRILDATDEERDDLVEKEVDELKNHGVVTRRAFLSEMLCLEYPGQYPVLNKPVYDYLAAVKFKAPRGASEGARYIDLARKLRFSLLQNPKHPAKNLAELDTVIWLAFGK
jgi:HKD family nuclease